MTSQPVAAGRQAAPGAARFSTSEFLRMLKSGAFDDMWVELIDRELARMPPPGNSHSAIAARLLILLGGVAPPALLRAGAGIDMGSDTILACDVALLGTPLEGKGMIPAGALSLVVEIAVSTRDRDLGLKRRLYAAAGIPTYWVIDAEREVIHLFDRPKDGDYAGLALARFGEPMTVPGTDGAILLE